MLRFGTVLLMIALCGCASPAERAEQLSEADDQTCTSYGLQFGTPAYAQCRQNIAAQRQARVAAAYALLANRPVAPALAPAPQTMLPVSPPVNTNCYALGNSVSCQSQ